MSNRTLKILPTLIVAITALVTQPVFGGVAVPNQLVMTETSSTSLDVTYNGAALMVTLDSPDHWHFTLPTPFVASQFLPFGWFEPEDSNNVNLLSLTPGAANSLSVASDVSLSLANVVLIDGDPIGIGLDFSTTPIQATFKDLGDVATVPDTGTTASLLGLSLTGLAFLRRKFC